MRTELDPVDAYIGRRLRQMRTAHGLTLERFAEQLDLAYQQIQKYERGVNRISASTMWRMTMVMDVTVGDFYEGLPSTTSSSAAQCDAADQRVAANLYRIENANVRKALLALIDALSSQRIQS